MADKLDILKLRRSQPEQGKAVDVQVYWNEEMAGLLVLPFAAWIKLNRLLQHGIDVDKKEGAPLRVKVKVEGAETEAQPAESVVQVLNLAVYRGGISNMAAEEEDEDIKAAEKQATLDAVQESQAKQQAEIVRSLRPEGGEENE